MRSLNSFPETDIHHDVDVIDRTFRVVLWIAGIFVLSLVAQRAHASETCLAVTYTPHVTTVNQGVSALVSADFDRDGDVDVWIPEANGIRRMTNLGNDTFSVSMLSVGSAVENLASADVDGDGDLDVLVAMTTSMRMLLNNGAGTFAFGPVTAFAANDNAPVGAYLRDLNTDGILDAVIVVKSTSNGTSFPGGVIVGLGAGNGSFSLLPTHPLQLPAGTSQLADLNGDGKLDVAILGGYITLSTIALSYGNGDGTFTAAPAALSAGLYAGAFGAGDLDGDGAVDLVYGNKYSYHVLHNDGTGSFTVGAPFNIGSYGKGVAIADIDHDGDLDLAATSGGGSAIRILMNDGRGNLTATNSLAASIQCYAVLLADTNGDGLLDPWAIDVTTGQLFRGSSHCIAATYGSGKTNSLGCSPTMGITGPPAISGSNFAITTTNELESQPALMLFGLAATDFTALAGHVLVAPPFTAIALMTSPGSGNPQICDGALSLAIPGASLGLVPVGTKIFVQTIAADPWIGDASGASLSNGLWFEIVP